MTTTNGLNTRYINTNYAKQLASRLRARGYKSATAENCEEYVANVVNRFGGADPDARREVTDCIASLLGVDPFAIDG